MSFLINTVLCLSMALIVFTCADDTSQTNNKIRKEKTSSESILSRKNNQLNFLKDEMFDEKRDVLNIENKITGVWKSRVLIDNYYTTIVSTYNESGSFLQTTYGASSQQFKGTYKYSENKLVNQYEDGNLTSFQVRWIDDVSLVLTSLSGKMQGSKNYFKLASSIKKDDEIPLSFWVSNGEGVTDNAKIGSGRTGTSQVRCLACDGTGLIKSSSYNVKTDCLTDEEKHRAYLSGNPDIKITCCYCRATGWVTVH